MEVWSHGHDLGPRLPRVSLGRSGQSRHERDARRRRGRRDVELAGPFLDRVDSLLGIHTREHQRIASDPPDAHDRSQPLVEAIDDESTSAVGNLTMHGITREVKLKAVVQGTEVDPWDKQRVGLEVIGVLKRSDFDMKFNQALGGGNVPVGDKVNMSLEISAVRQE